MGDDDNIINLAHVKKIRLVEKSIYFAFNYPDDDWEKRTFDEEENAIEFFNHLRKSL